VTDICATEEELPVDITDTLDELSGVLEDRLALTAIVLMGPVVAPVNVTLLPESGSVRL
jgi:hypothetical protein